MPKGQKLPPDVIEHWPEIFEDVEIKAIPFEYVKSIEVYFDDGKSWCIEVDQQNLEENSFGIIENSLESFFDRYDDVIEGVDLNIDTEKVKKDITARTKSFLKKRK